MDGVKPEELTATLCSIAYGDKAFPMDLQESD
jgi:hypothetical protein